MQDNNKTSQFSSRRVEPINAQSRLPTSHPLKNSRETHPIQSRRYMGQNAVNLGSAQPDLQAEAINNGRVNPHSSAHQNAAVGTTVHRQQENQSGPVYSTSLEDRHKEIKKNKGTVKGIAMSIFSLIAFFGTALVFALVVNKFVIQSYQVVGSSMSPTLEQDDWLVISKVGKTWSRIFDNEYIPSRGDIIVFGHPSDSEDKSLIKRVIALPGERVELVNDGLRVFNDEFPNGFDPDEDYKDILETPGDNLASYAPSLVGESITVPEGELFVSGDNRSPGGSLDSRGNLGTVPDENIAGVLKARLYPLWDIDFRF